MSIFKDTILFSNLSGTVTIAMVILNMALAQKSVHTFGLWYPPMINFVIMNFWKRLECYFTSVTSQDESYLKH